MGNPKAVANMVSPGREPPAARPLDRAESHKPLRSVGPGYGQAAPMANAAPLVRADLLRFQRSAGNAAINRFLQGEGTPLGSPAATGTKRPLLYRGSHGKDVRVLQQRLNALGATPALKVDADFGQKTHVAVVAFQTAHFPDDKSQWDGKVGSKTWAAIDDASQTPDIEANDAAMGDKVVAGMDRVNAPGSTADSGVWYAYNYRAYHPEKFNADMESGLADATYFERKDFMTWKLKPKMSASAAIRSWLDGLTIAECYTALLAVEYETLRAAVGNAAFDKEFGSADRETPEDRRLTLAPKLAAPGKNRFMKQADAAKTGETGKAGDRPASVGDWFYFMNHPRYLLKHPAGAWQGENSVYMGRTNGIQMWAGMGTDNNNPTAPSTRVTEMEMLNAMVAAYNRPRDSDDEARLVQVRAENGGVLPDELEPTKKFFPDQLSGPSDILSAPAEKLKVKGLVDDDFERKGGFDARAGKSLDANAVKALRESGGEE
ncbi:MAG: peptidoglycan-binding protein [bacterium]